jgi:hypothetical protein
MEDPTAGQRKVKLCMPCFLPLFLLESLFLIEALFLIESLFLSKAG